MGSGPLKARFFSSAALALLLSAALASAATATTVDITFTATTGSGAVGSNAIEAASGDTLTAMVSLTADAAGVSSYGISLRFDSDFGDELNFVSVTELLTSPFAFNLTPGCDSTQESAGAQGGHVFTCEAATLGTGLTSGASADIFEIVFAVTGNVATDGFDIQTGVFNTGFDGVFGNAGGSLSPTFGGASVNTIIPEPNTVLLLGLGLIGLAVNGRKPRS